MKNVIERFKKRQNDFHQRKTIVESKFFRVEQSINEKIVNHVFENLKQWNSKNLFIDDDKIINSYNIVTKKQLKYWIDHNFKQFLKIFNEFRKNLKLNNHVILKWNFMQNDYQNNRFEWNL